MSSNSCNSNQNHLVHGRSTSRVLQAPGGNSSFSLGSGGMDFTDYKRTNQGNQHQQQQRAPLSNVGSGKYDNDRRCRDSLDNLMTSGSRCSQPNVIPGLEQRRQSSYREEPENRNYNVNSSHSQRGTTGPLATNEYAQMLKNQIEAKRQMQMDDNCDSQRGRSRNMEYQNDDDNYQSQPRGRMVSQPQGQGQQVQAQWQAERTGRIRNPPGGASSFSLGWN